MAAQCLVRPLLANRILAEPLATGFRASTVPYVVGSEQSDRVADGDMSAVVGDQVGGEQKILVDVAVTAERE